MSGFRQEIIMSEDKKKETNESRKVTSDEKNKASSYSGSNASKKAGAPSDADFNADDEILDLIRKRKEDKDTEADGHKETVMKEAPDKSAEKKAAAVSSSEKKAAAGKPDAKGKTVKAEKSDSKTRTEKADKPDTKAKTEASKDAAEPVSELEKELAKDFAENNSKRRTVKRYGFKPYTRELQAEEINVLQEAERALQENNAEESAAGVAGIIKKMTKGTGRKKKSNGASGTAKI